MPRPALATTSSSRGCSNPILRSRTACWYRSESGARPATTRWRAWGYATSASPLICATSGTRRRACGRRGPRPGARAANRRIRSVVRPDGEFVAARVAEVEAAAAGEGERLPHDAAPRLLHIRFELLQVAAVDDDQRPSRPRRLAAREAPRESAVLKARVIGPVVFEPPAEHCGIELFRTGDVGRGEFHVVNLAIAIGLRHGSACSGGAPARSAAPSSAALAATKWRAGGPPRCRTLPRASRTRRDSPPRPARTSRLRPTRAHAAQRSRDRRPKARSGPPR